MNNYPASFIEIATDMVEKYPEDIPKCVAKTEESLRKLPEFGEFTNTLITEAIRELVYDIRHSRNVGLKRQAGLYGGEGKVKQIRSDFLNKVYQSYYDFCIAGRRLGTVLGKELAKLAEQEQGQINGHSVNKRVLEMLQPLVADEKAVKECVTEKKLGQLFNKAMKEVEAA